MDLNKDGKISFEEYEVYFFFSRKFNFVFCRNLSIFIINIKNEGSINL